MIGTDKEKEETTDIEKVYFQDLLFNVLKMKNVSRELLIFFVL